ncbi:MAG: primosomal protein N' [Parcubacteria group bacterium]|nr:primosomal protein N' [Parcubacteria group bacterium]
MYIVHVIPLSRSMQKETLSYFTAQPVSAGDMVLIPLRKKEIPAIVTDIQDATSLKTNIKQSSYGLRKISKILFPHFFLPAFISAAEKSARYFACSSGAVIDSLVPKAILDSIIKTAAHIETKVQASVQNTPNTFFETLVLQASFKDRIVAYKGIIREEFAKGKSVLLLIPTADDIPYILSILERGIEEHTYVIHGGLSKQKIISLWHKALGDTHPILIIGTGMSVSIPREDLRTIIVEREGSWLYKQEHRPFIDVRIYAEYFAEALHGKCVLGGTVLSLETLYRREQRGVSDFAPPQFRLLSSAEQSTVDMRGTHSPLQLTPKTFTVISDELKDAIEDVRKHNQHILLYVTRRGLFPITLCSDCGATVLCKQCEAPLVLHKDTGEKRAGERVYLCHKCKEENVVTDRCKRCNSWRLAPLGVGTERVEEEARCLFRTIKVLRVDKDKTPTRKKAEKMISEFLNSPGSILVGTELALTLLKKKIAVTAAVSIDPLFALPSFRTYERAFNILLSLREKANKKFIIQTRIPDLHLFKYVQNGNITDFYREEKKTREQFGYPPFTTIIKLTMSGTKQYVEKETASIKKHLHGYDLFIFPAFISKIRGKYVVHVVLKMKREEWPNEKLRERLLALPPSVVVNVNPEHLL